MAKYVLRRILNLIFQVFLVVSLMFLLFRLLPGDPATIILGANATQAEIEQLREMMGLNDNIFVQYAHYIQNLLTGDFGYSMSYGQDVIGVILPRIWPTIQLMLSSIGVAVVIGVPAGVLCGVYPYSKISKLFLTVWVGFLAVPNFWLGLILVQIFAVKLNWLPSIGYGSVAAMVLPTLAIAARLIALIARMTRSSVMEVTSEEYIGYARAKGLKEKTVVLKHTLRPALPSIITMVGMQAGYLLGGSIVIENLFSYPGIGQLLMAAVSVRDYELMQGITFFFVLAFLTINLIVDLLYGRIDPRIRSE